MTDTASPRRRLHPAARVVLIIGAVVVAVNVVLRIFDSTTRGADETAPRSSSFSTGTTGVAAWGELLERNGRSVDQRRGSLDDEHLDPEITLVVLDPDEIDTGEARAVADFVQAGGRLVAGGASSVSLLDEVLDDSPQWAPVGVREAEPRDAAPEVDGLSTVEASDHGSWDEAGDSTVVLADGGRVLATVADVGRGRVVMLADSAPLQNRLLARADNAALALAIAGDDGDTVSFAEGAHGYGEATGLGAIPDRWKVALAGLLVASLLGAVAAGRRLGPPEEERRSLPPPRRAYVDALAEALSRTRRPAEALEPLQARARADLVARAGLPSDAGEDDIRAAGARIGWEAAELEALLRPVRDDDDTLAAGRALARVKGERL